MCVGVLLDRVKLAAANYASDTDGVSTAGYRTDTLLVKLGPLWALVDFAAGICTDFRNPQAKPEMTVRTVVEKGRRMSEGEGGHNQPCEHETKRRLHT